MASTVEDHATLGEDSECARDRMRACCGWSELCSNACELKTRESAAGAGGDPNPDLGA